MDDGSFYQIIDYFNLSRRGYRKVRKGVKKRIARHMRQLGCRRVGDYLAAVSRAPEIETECRRHLTVSISRFFRDRRLWDFLESKALPPLMAHGAGPLRVWSCGCARGEEAYSFAILWDRLCHGSSDGPTLEEWATDIHPVYIEMAQKGIYGPSSLRELPREAIGRYFDKLPARQLYIVKAFLREGIRFQRHDVTQRPPPSERFEVVFVRNNLLTYYRSPEKEKAFEAILRVIAPGGLLIIGSHEKLPAGVDLIRASDDCPWIFLKPP